MLAKGRTKMQQWITNRLDRAEQTVFLSLAVHKVVRLCLGSDDAVTFEYNGKKVFATAPSEDVTTLLPQQLFIMTLELAVIMLLFRLAWSCFRGCFDTYLSPTVRRVVVGVMVACIHLSWILKLRQYILTNT
jgi:hypothetical protein